MYRVTEGGFGLLMIEGIKTIFKRNTMIVFNSNLTIRVCSTATLLTPNSIWSHSTQKQ